MPQFEWAGLKREIAKRDRHLDGKAVLLQLGATRPDRIPLQQICDVALKQRIDAGAERIHLEIIGVAPGQLRIDVNAHAIVDIHVGVRRPDRCNDLLGLAIIGIDRNVEGVVVVEKARDRGLGRGQARPWIGPIELVDCLRLGPNGLRGIAIDRRRFARVDPYGDARRYVIVEVARGMRTGTGVSTAKELLKATNQRRSRYG